MMPYDFYGDSFYKDYLSIKDFIKTKNKTIIVIYTEESNQGENVVYTVIQDSDCHFVNRLQDAGLILK